MSNEYEQLKSERNRLKSILDSAPPSIRHKSHYIGTQKMYQDVQGKIKDIFRKSYGRV